MTFLIYSILGKQEPTTLQDLADLLMEWTQVDPNDAKKRRTTYNTLRSVLSRTDDFRGSKDNTSNWYICSPEERAQSQQDRADRVAQSKLANPPAPQQGEPSGDRKRKRGD